jgi:hypothetical protein
MDAAARLEDVAVRAQEREASRAGCSTRSWSMVSCSVTEAQQRPTRADETARTTTQGSRSNNPSSGEVQYRRTWVFVNSLSSTLAQSLRNDTDVTGYKIPRIHYPQVNEAVRQRLLRVAVAASSIERVYSSYTDIPPSMELQGTCSGCRRSRCMVKGIPTFISCCSCIYIEEKQDRDDLGKMRHTSGKCCASSS